MLVKRVGEKCRFRTNENATLVFQPGSYKYIRHRASSAGRDQLPAGPPLPLGNDQGPRGRMTQDGHRPEVIIGHPPHFLKFPGILGDSPKPVFASFFRCVKDYSETKFWHQK